MRYLRQPIEDFLTGVEKAVVSLPVETTEEVRQEAVRILKASSRPRDNLCGAERWALRSLRTNADVTVLHADKGNATAVLNTKDYKDNISALLRAPTYRRLVKGPTEAVKRKTTLLLNKSSLPKEVVQQLRPQGSRPPRLYGLPKIHKEGVPLRPIVSTIGASTYRLAGLLGVHIGGSPHRVRNSMEVINTIHTLRARPRDILAGFDVISLFTLAPIEKALRLLSRHFLEAILRLFRHVLTSSFFSFNGHFYEQTDGVGIGSPLSPVIPISWSTLKKWLWRRRPINPLLVSLSRRHIRH
jgi:hypothetical protein